MFSGNPPPSVVWLKNGEVIDPDCEHKSIDLTENRLTWRSVSRQDLKTDLTCQASNTELMEPREASVKLDLIREYWSSD